MDNTSKTPLKKELIEINEELVRKNEELKTQICDGVEERAKMSDDLARMNERVNAIMDAQSNVACADDSTHDLNPTITYDPFDEQNPHAILTHPEGWVLSWKNPDYRAHRGWRGWVPVEHDDEIGQNLDKYLNDPPAKMQGMDTIDNYVRRGTDSILCKLPKNIWDARQAKRDAKAKFRFEQSQSAEQTRNTKYTTYGDGAVASDSKHLPPLADNMSAMKRTELFRKD